MSFAPLVLYMNQYEVLAAKRAVIGSEFQAYGASVPTVVEATSDPGEPPTSL